MKRFSLLFIIVIAFVGCSKNDGEEIGQSVDEGMEDVTLFLDWTPNTNHTGIYVAKEKGYYAEAGIDLDILLPGEVSPEQLVATNQGEFAISFQDHVIHARTEDIPIVSIGAVIQHETSGYASPKDRGIESPEDFNGKVYGAYGSSLEEPTIRLVMERAGAEMEDVEIVQLGTSDFFMATKRDVDFASMFYAWTGIEAELRGIDLNFIKRTDFAEELNSYAPLIITSEKMIEENHDVVASFMEATTKGYQFAMDHPAEAANLLSEAEPDLDPELVSRSQEWLVDHYQADAEKWGIQEEERWQNFADFMYDYEIIDEKIDVTEAFTNEFIP